MTYSHRLLTAAGAAALWLLAAVAPSSAQTTQYWTDQFGNRAQLLGGAVIASDESLSSVFYNPGLLGTGAGSELIVTGNIFEAETLTVREVEPPNREVSDSRFRLLPSMVAGEIFGSWLGDNRLAYSFFTRANSRLRADTLFGSDKFPDLPLDFLSNSLRIDSSMSEYWGGFTWGRGIGDNQGLGVSMFVGARNHRSRVQTVDQAIFEDGDLGLAIRAEDFDFNNYRLFWKLGYSTEFVGWKIGATLTTPSINLFGSGKLKFDDSLVLTGRPEDSRITTTFQEDLSTEYKTPLSIGLGASRNWDRWSLHFSMEWYDSVAPFTVIDGENFFSQTTGEEFDPDITHALDSVVNFAIGIERTFASGVRAYGSFRSDFGAATNEFKTNMAVLNWDLWHLSGGTTFAVGSTDMTLGVAYGFGTSDPSQPISAGDTPIEVSFNRITVVLGFELPTGNKN